MKILIADDHDLLLDTLVTFLEREGTIEIATASDLDGALNRIDTEGPFDLVILDFGMPGMSGFNRS